MLQFFRKMRSALIPENRFGRYFFYALGEIVLVVIGILIALSINNWNQERINLKEEQRLLKLIHIEMEDYLWLNERGIKQQQKILDAVERLLIAMKSSPDNLDFDQINKDLHDIYTIRWFIGGDTNVYDVLANGGKIGLISSMQLQQKLANLKEDFGYSQIYNELQARFIDNQLSPFLNQYIDRISVSNESLELAPELLESQFSSSYNELFTNREFSNLLAELIKHTKPILASYKRINKLIGQIDSLAMEGNTLIEPGILKD